MKITDLVVTTHHQALQDKTWEFARARLTENVGLLIEIRTADGVTGFGYAVQGLHLGEAIEGMRQVVDGLFRPLLVGRDAFENAAIGADLERAVPRFMRTKAAVDAALFDLMGKALGVPVHDLLGGCYRTSIPVVRMLPIKTPLEMARNAEAVVADGYRYLKVKVGLDARLDVVRMREIRAAVGPDIQLMVDANQGWTPRAAVNAIVQMEPYDVAIVEQPVRADDHVGLRHVRQATRTVIEADESANSLSDVMTLARADCVDAVNLKLGKFGSLRATQAAAAMCASANLGCRLGFTGASRLNAAADMHVIAATPNISFACEVGEFTRMESDPGEGLEIVGGELTVPRSPGLGVSVTQA